MKAIISFALLGAAMAAPASLESNKLKFGDSCVAYEAKNGFYAVTLVDCKDAPKYTWDAEKLRFETCVDKNTFCLPQKLEVCPVEKPIKPSAPVAPKPPTTKPLPPPAAGCKKVCANGLKPNEHCECPKDEAYPVAPCMNVCAGNVDPVRINGKCECPEANTPTPCMNVCAGGMDAVRNNEGRCVCPTPVVCNIACEGNMDPVLVNGKCTCPMPTQCMNVCAGGMDAVVNSQGKCVCPRPVPHDE